MIRDGVRAAAMLLLLGAGSTTAGMNTPSLKTLYADAATGEYEVPYDDELARAEQLFRRTLSEAWNKQLSNAWLALGFEFFQHREGGETFGILKEIDARQSGRGFYVFRQTQATPKLLQMPHRFGDLFTGRLGIEMMSQGAFSVAAWNTVPRAEVDFAHTQSSYFNALTRAFGALFPAGRTIQIHGFAQGKRKTLAGQQADFILSNGTRTPGDAVRSVDECITRNTAYSAYSYPLEVQELGGTTNAQGKALRALGNHGFLHVEMSYPYRKAATKKRSLRAAFFACLDDL